MFNRIFLFLSFLTFLGGCQKEPINNPPPPDPFEEVIVAENVIVLNKEQTNILTLVEDDKLIFAEGDSTTNAIKIGDILVAGVSNTSPNGFLRKVTGVSINGNTILVETENAQLTDAIEQGSIRFEKKLTSGDFVGKQSSLNFDLSLGEDSPLSGYVTIDPTLIFDLDIDFFEVQYAKLGIRINYNAGMTLDVQEEIEYQLKKKLVERDLKPITFYMGIFPIVITPDFEIEAGFDYADQKAFITKYNIGGHQDYFIEKNSNGWRTEKEVVEDGSSAGISTNVSMSFQAYLQPQIEFEFYDIEDVSTTFYAKKYVKGEFVVSNEELPTCKLSCGAAFGGKAEVKILGFEINPSPAEYEADFATFYECPENGLTEEINAFIPDSILNILEDLDMPINEGFDPPNIVGKYFVTPSLLKSTNIPNDYDIGYKFADLTIEFYNFNPEELTLTVKQSTSTSEGDGTGSFIVGTGNNFSVFAELRNEFDNGSKSVLGIVYSGEITENGIRDFHSSLVMLDDFGDVNNELIAIGQARVFLDGDGFSPKQ